jgi:hypothetical protein
LATARVRSSCDRWPPESEPSPLSEVEVELFDPARGDLVVPGGIEIGTHAKVLRHREAGIDRCVLGDEADPGELAAPVCGAPAQHLDPARARG